MSLQKQLAHLNMTGGLQKKDDDFLVIPSKLTTALNVEFDDASTLRVRDGWSRAPLTTGIPYRGFSHQGEGIVEAAGGVYWTRGQSVINPQVIDGQQTPILRRRASAATRRVTSVQRKTTALGAGNPIGEGSHDYAVTTGGIGCHVYDSQSARTGRMQSHWTVIDESNGHVFASGVLLDSTNITLRPRVHATPTGFVVVYASYASGAQTFNVRATIINSDGSLGSTANVFVGATTFNPVESATGDYAVFDTCPDATGANFALVVRSDLGFFSGLLQISTAFISSSALTTAASNVFAVGAQPTFVTALYTTDGVTARVHAFYDQGANAVSAVHMNASTSVLSGATVVATGPAATTVRRITARQMSASEIQLAFDCVRLPTLGVYSTLHLARFSHTHGSILQCSAVRPWVIAGGLFVVGGVQYLPMAFVSSTLGNQNTLFVVDVDQLFNTTYVAGTPPAVLARIDYGEGALDYPKWVFQMQVPRVGVVGTAAYVPYLKYETEVRLVGGSTANANDSGFAVATATLNFTSQLSHVEVNGVVILAGACPQIFDGQSLVEEGFHHAPELLALPTVVAGAGGTYDLPAGVAATYTVCFTYGWLDAQGNWHESAPSPEYQVTTTVANNSFNVDLAPTPTQKAGVQLIMYRTLGSSTDTSLYQHTRQDGTQVTSDALLVFGEQLYTTGGVLPNEPAPACRDVAVFQGRVVATGTGDGSGVTWSKVSERGYGVEFCSSDPLHRLTAPSAAGRAVASREMDDRLFILCERAIGAIAGAGPAATGTQGQYSDFATLVSEFGCVWEAPRSAVRTSDGIWFRSSFGLRLVSRSGSLAIGQDGKQVGSEVDSLVPNESSMLDVVAVVGPTKQQVRFYTPFWVLVWDFQWRQWAQWAAPAPGARLDAFFADGRFYHLSSYANDSWLLYTNPTALVDETTSGQAVVQAAIETAWLSFAGIQGFQRVYRLMMLGRDVSNNSNSTQIGLSVRHDFDSTAYVETASGTATGDTQQLQHHFQKQKCESMRLRITMASVSTSAQNRFRLTDLTLQVGVKAGYNKLPSSKRF